ncbi:TMEM175 family protein [Sphingopyxis sp. CCNWLW253]|uniref:TMEM175 family protein n=1 Tax=unclassified Sphingopyxis TaxID=2614943 RepID=UPI0030131E4D
MSDSDPTLGGDIGRRGMPSGRMEALTDGVVAIVITVMVIELRVPAGNGWVGLAASLPLLLVYALSFVNVGLFWNNHHHLLQATGRIDGRVLWANLFHLFWLSLIPYTIRWLDESGFAALAVAAYGVILGMASIGYELLVRTIIASHPGNAVIARAVGRDIKGRVSVASYALAAGLALVHPGIALAIYLAIILLWLVPDRRMERILSD